MVITVENAPVGSIAPAIGGGHWTRTERGWEWCTGATFPRPGGDWTGEIRIPFDSEDTQEQGHAWNRFVLVCAAVT